ncbi:hypothetical protein SAMN04488003_10550 [Loktanella fryxellensis]|uniref:Transferrin-binding protein B C-lobe/N-lobe beta barrel domain-containing protein n=1 Tax=Loktanella fryxellensis TaxID=245187 RepID=A0A1H8BHL6_9RHOB|nr:hypothetical protein [Loktanella fryxellensis]SEM82312.1 hypothetical protein SAMN04488003_10550 [Loktanella fryxellensis]
MRHPIRFLASLSALVVVAACGGTTVPTTPVDPDRLSLREIKRVESEIRPGYDAARVTPKAQVPVSGQATYAGYVAGDMSLPTGNTDVAGVMVMGVDFTNNRVGGTVGNFVTSRNEEMDGTLSLRNGVLDRRLNSSQVTIRSDVDGRLVDESGDTYVLDGAITRGGFKGSSGQYVGVPMTGSVVTDAGVSRGTQRGTFGLTGILER